MIMETERIFSQEDNGRTVLRFDISFMPAAIQDVNQFMTIGALCFTITSPAPLPV